MKWLLLSLCVLCFFAFGGVVCKAPDELGDTSTQAGSVSEQCRPSATGTASGAVDRDIGVAEIVEVVAATDVSDDDEPPSSGDSGDSGDSGGTK